MTALELRADLFEEIIQNADNTDILQKVLDFFRSLTKKKTDKTLMTEADFFLMLEQSRREAAEGKTKDFTDLDKMHDWLNGL